MKRIVALGLTVALPVFAQEQPDAGLAEWLLQERTRDEAEADRSRSINQTAPRPTPRPGN